jgi:hypothetical protein
MFVDHEINSTTLQKTRLKKKDYFGYSSACCCCYFFYISLLAYPNKTDRMSRDKFIILAFIIKAASAAAAMRARE